VPSFKFLGVHISQELAHLVHKHHGSDKEGPATTELPETAQKEPSESEAAGDLLSLYS